MIGVISLIHVVLPVAPTNVAVVAASTPNKVEVTWTLNPGMPDERPDSLTLTLQSNQSVAEEYVLPGNQTHFCLGVVPGMQYQVLISAHNQAGISKAVPFDFETDPAGKFTNKKKRVQFISLRPIVDISVIVSP